MEELNTMGCDAVATGHYARILETKDGFGLFKGEDPKKDQSYFLSRIPKEKLSRILFPLGDTTKETVRNIAAEAGIAPVSKGESQDICFIKEGSYVDFLENLPGFSMKPGDVVTTDGKKIGRHDGLHRFTIGQRKGINIPGPAPYYVIRFDGKRNTLVVGFKDDLLAAGCIVADLNWLIPAPEDEKAVTIKIRYRHQDVPATLSLLPEGRVAVRFADAQRAITPGQGAVFYDGDRVLGGGIITGAL